LLLLLVSRTVSAGSPPAEPRAEGEAGAAGAAGAAASAVEAGEGRLGRVSEVNLGLTQADLKDVPVAFDGKLGWVARHWSVEANALRSFIKTRPDNRIEKNSRWSAGMAARWLPGGASDRLRFEARGEASYLALQDGWQRLGGNSREYENFDATQVGALAGLRFRGEATSLRVSAGLGWQRLTYNSFAYSESPTPLRDEAGSTTGGWQSLRAYLRHELKPGWVTLRLSGESSRFSLQRVQFTRRGDAVPIDSDWVNVSSTETLSRLRLNLDFEPLAFAGSVPGLFAGGDLATTSSSPDSPRFALIFGFGIVQQGERE
jgi:hypothetical protein